MRAFGAALPCGVELCVYARHEGGIQGLGDVVVAVLLLTAPWLHAGGVPVIILAQQYQVVCVEPLWGVMR